MRSVTLTETTTKEVCRLQFPDSMTVFHILPIVRAAISELFNPHISALHTLEAEHGADIFSQDIYEAPDGGESIYTAARAKRAMVATVAMAVSGFKAAEKKHLVEMVFTDEEDVTSNRITANVALLTIGMQDAKSLDLLAQEAPAPARAEAPAPAAPTPAPQPRQPAKAAPAPAPEPEPEPEPEPTREDSGDVEVQAEDGGGIDETDAGEPQAEEDTYTEVKPADPAPAAANDAEDFDPAAQAALTEANKRRTRRF